MSLMADSVKILHFLYRNGPIGTEAVRALELRCPGDTLSWIENLRGFALRDSAGNLMLNPIVMSLLNDLEGNLGTFPPKDWLFQFPLGERYGKPEIFLAMPFGEEWSDKVKVVMERAATAAGFDATRGDANQLTGTIMNQVWDYIRHADAVIADVSGRNPNVLYEAGMAHALGKPVVLLLQEEEKAPFDIVAERRIRYRLDNLPRLEQELGEAIAALPKLPQRDLADLDR